jgi:hypothetical protein
MDRWLQTGTLKRKSNNENETNSNIQQFLEEAASYSPPPSNVSSSSGAHSRSNVLKATNINSVKRRKYFDSYLSVGFTQDSGETSPRILCNEVLQNSSMVPSKLKHHFETKHIEHKGKPLSFFQRMLNNLSSMKAYMHTKLKSENENALMASMKVSYCIAHGGEMHTIGE